MKQQRAKALRCAIYPRVSTAHGLEQEFNSLDNVSRPAMAARWPGSRRRRAAASDP